MKAAVKRLVYEHPAGNIFLIMLIAVSYALQTRFDPNVLHIRFMILKGWNLSGMLGYMWLHMNWIHVLESLATLCVFGHYVARRISPRIYVVFYILMGIMGAGMHLLFDSRPAVGASGAIMGVLGMHLVLCYRDMRSFELFLTGLWFSISLVLGYAHVGASSHFSHIGGFLGGMVLAGLSVMTGWADPSRANPLFVQWCRKNCDKKNHTKQKKAAE